MVACYCDRVWESVTSTDTNVKYYDRGSYVYILTLYWAVWFDAEINCTDTEREQEREREGKEKCQYKHALRTTEQTNRNQHEKKQTLENKIRIRKMGIEFSWFAIAKATETVLVLRWAKFLLPSLFLLFIFFVVVWQQPRKIFGQKHRINLPDVFLKPDNFCFFLMYTTLCMLKCNSSLTKPNKFVSIYLGDFIFFVFPAPSWIMYQNDTKHETLL